MTDQPPHRTLAGPGETLPPDGAAGSAPTPSALAPTPSGAAALAAAH
jgi:hypothetical protein